MITKFDSLFAGHVDMEDVGYGGTPVNDRSYPDEHLATAFDKSLAIAQLMDRSGYDTFWMAEHHFQPEGYECLPNILLLSVHMAHLTERINFGCGFNITPMWHPLRLAEDFATADILTKGRIIFGVGRGYHTREVESFGSPLLDQAANPNLLNIDGLGPLYATVNMRFASVSWAPNPPTEQETVDSLDLLRALLEQGADPNARITRKLWFSPTSHDRGWADASGSTPFWRAAQSSDVESMKILVEGGADPNLSTYEGITPLMVAAGIGWVGNFTQSAPNSFLAAIRYCFELGADVNAIDSKGFTALHGAAGRGDMGMVEYLVGEGARADAINDDGNSPADMAFGPSRFFIPKPDTVDLLVGLGSPFQDNCRSDQCVDGKFFGGTGVSVPK